MDNQIKELEEIFERANDSFLRKTAGCLRYRWRRELYAAL